MNADQCAQVLDAYAGLRAEYIHGFEASDNPVIIDTERYLRAEVDAIKKAAHILRNLDQTPISLPSWRYGDWPRIVSDIRDGS